MPDSFAMKALHTQALVAAQELRKCNEISERYGLTLTETQIQSLVQSRFDALRFTGRMELGGDILPKLIYAFCDSPHISRIDYSGTLAALQELFYTFKNESEDAMSDDELMEAMKRCFNGKAQGSLEYLENLSISDLYRALTGNSDDEDDDDDSDDEDGYDE